MFIHVSMNSSGHSRTCLITQMKLLQTGLRQEGDSSLDEGSNEFVTRAIPRYRACQLRNFLASAVCSSPFCPSSPYTFTPSAVLATSFGILTSFLATLIILTSMLRASLFYTCTLYVPSMATRLRYYERECPPQALSPCCIGCS